MADRKCDRHGCGNTECTKHSIEHGYICDECFDELCSRGPDVDVTAFMMIRKRLIKPKTPHEIFQPVTAMTMSAGKE